MYQTGEPAARASLWESSAHEFAQLPGDLRPPGPPKGDQVPDPVAVGGTQAPSPVDQHHGKGGQTHELVEAENGWFGSRSRLTSKCSSRRSARHCRTAVSKHDKYLYYRKLKTYSR